MDTIILPYSEFWTAAEALWRGKKSGEIKTIINNDLYIEGSYRNFYYEYRTIEDFFIYAYETEYNGFPTQTWSIRAEEKKITAKWFTKTKKEVEKYFKDNYSVIL